MAVDPGRAGAAGQAGALLDVSAVRQRIRDEVARQVASARGIQPCAYLLCPARELYIRFTGDSPNQQRLAIMLAAEHTNRESPERRVAFVFHVVNGYVEVPDVRTPGGAPARRDIVRIYEESVQTGLRVAEATVVGSALGPFVEVQPNLEPGERAYLVAPPALEPRRA